MVLNPEKTFGNPFDDSKIIPNNFGRFADDTIAKQKQNNNKKPKKTGKISPHYPLKTRKS